MNTPTIVPRPGNGHVPSVDQTQENVDQPQENKVLTPGGYKPRSKVYLLEKNYHVASRDGKLWLIDSIKGEVMALDAQVTPSAPDSGLQPAAAGGQTPDIPSAKPGEEWVAYTEFRNLPPSPLSLFTAEWTVPDPPKDQNNQTIFIFIGLQNNDFILQPVLQWGPSHAGGGQFWTISNWYTDGTTKDTVCTHAVEVKPGIKLQARIELLGQVNRLFTYKVSFPGFPALDYVQNKVMELFWAFIVLESYNINDNDQYPSTQQTQVTVLEIATETAELSVAWRPVIAERTGIHPHAEVDANTINLKYR